MLAPPLECKNMKGHFGPTHMSDDPTVQSNVTIWLLLETDANFMRVVLVSRKWLFRRFHAHLPRPRVYFFQSRLTLISRTCFADLAGCNVKASVKQIPGQRPLQPNRETYVMTRWEQKQSHTVQGCFHWAYWLVVSSVLAWFWRTRASCRTHTQAILQALHPERSARSETAPTSQCDQRPTATEIDGGAPPSHLSQEKHPSLQPLPGIRADGQARWHHLEGSLAVVLFNRRVPHHATPSVQHLGGHHGFIAFPTAKRILTKVTTPLKQLVP